VSETGISIVPVIEGDEFMLISIRVGNSNRAFLGVSAGSWPLARMLSACRNGQHSRSQIKTSSSTHADVFGSHHHLPDRSLYHN
jgi:hypothetical protein